MSKCYFLLYGAIIFSMLIPISIDFQSTYAAPITLDINKAKIPGPGFSDEKIGSLLIDPQNKTLDISINITETPAQDKIFEAWLVDTGGSDYKLSLGAIDGNSLKTSTHMVNPYTYSEFIITEEPLDDVDPNAADTYGGTELEAPFGQ